MKYLNNVNSIPMYEVGLFGERVYYAILAELENKHTQDIVVPYCYLRQLISYSPKKTYTMLTSELYNLVEPFCRVEMNMEVDEVRREIRVHVSREIFCAVNDVKQNFTSFPLKEFVSLGSVHDMYLYRRLKQFKKVGEYLVTVERLRVELGIPKATPEPAVRRIIQRSIKSLNGRFGFSDIVLHTCRNKRGIITTYQLGFLTEESRTYKRGVVEWGNQNGFALFSEGGVIHSQEYVEHIDRLALQDMPPQFYDDSAAKLERDFHKSYIESQEGVLAV